MAKRVTFGRRAPAPKPASRPPGAAAFRARSVGFAFGANVPPRKGKGGP